MSSKRPRGDATDASTPRARVSEEDARAPVSLKSLLERWNLGDVVNTAGVSRRIKCRLVPVCRTKDDERARIARGEPVICASAEYASEVFDAIGTARDGLAWATRSSFSNFDAERGKVAMRSGWGAPGTHVLSNRDMTIVTSFAEVVDPANEKPLNLQMFHREDTAVPVLSRKLKWPSEEEFFGIEGEDAPGRLLDDATRVSARGAMTWWHLDDCGEFVCQVGLPEAGEAAEDVLLGPTGKPVVKLFIFAQRKDYAWVAQDAEMNKSYKNCALDLFDTPDHYYPTASEMCHPSSAPLDVSSPKAFDGAATSDDAEDPCPTFWVAPLEAGGPPLLSPPNIIHCVLTVRDCVMCEERRLSLAYMDEVLYFQRRAARWCEPPIFYAFVREDLSDTEKARSNAMRPLVKMLNDLKRVGATDGDAYRFARCLTSLRVLANHSPEFYALDADGVAEARKSIDELESWLADGSNCEFVEKIQAAVKADPRAVEDAELAESMMSETLGVLNLADGRSCAVVHERGRPRWGPVRNSKSLVDKDRKDMKNAIRSGTLDALLLAYRRDII